MKLVELTKDMPHAGLKAGAVLNVDQRSAKALIKRGDAKEYEPDKPAEREETVDDIESTARPGGRAPVMSVARVGFADPGPAAATVAEAEDAPDPVESAPAAATEIGGANGPESQPADAAPTPAPSKKAAAKKQPPAAPGAQPAGGDAGGGATQ